MTDAKMIYFVWRRDQPLIALEKEIDGSYPTSDWLCGEKAVLNLGDSGFEFFLWISVVINSLVLGDYGIEYRHGVA